MDQVSRFKDFVRNNSFLIDYIKRGEKSWQDFYQLYDLYGEDENIWNQFLRDSTKDRNINKNYFDELIQMTRNIDVDKVQEGIVSLQKTLGLFGDLLGNKNHSSSEYQPRPLYRRFDD